MLPVAKQIAEALEAAHELGIVHRDLKPANIKVRPDGTVKVLDFGLAKALQVEASGIDASNSPTLSLSAATHMGTILGTAAYMAPEQAKGRPVDRRADVWAFGVVLYEMLARQRAFKGDDISDTLVAVLRDEPDWSALPADLPASVRQTLRVCLQKDPKRRVRDIGAIRLALDGAFESPASVVAAAPPAKPRPRWPVVLPWALGAAVLAATGGVGGRRQPRPAPPGARRTVRHHDARRCAAGHRQRSAVSRCLPMVPACSTGRRAGWRSARTNSAWFLRDRGQLEPTLVRGTEGGVGAFFSPDGEWIAFFHAWRRRAQARAGARRAATDDLPSRGRVLRGQLGARRHHRLRDSDGNGLSKVPGVGGVLRRCSQRAEPAQRCRASLAGGAARRLRRALHGVDRDGGPIAHRAAVVRRWQHHPLVNGGTAPRFARSGHLVFAEGGSLRAVRFDPVDDGPSLETLFRSSRAWRCRPWAARTMRLARMARWPTSLDRRRRPPRTLVWVDRQGRQTAINVPPRAYTYARLSPDGTRVALDARDQQNDIWIWDLARETLQRLTNDPGLNRLPVWTPDGTRVAYTAERDGQPESIYWQAADGSGRRRAAERRVDCHRSPVVLTRRQAACLHHTRFEHSVRYRRALTLDGARRERRC